MATSAIVRGTGVHIGGIVLRLNWFTLPQRRNYFDFLQRVQIIDKEAKVVTCPSVGSLHHFVVRVSPVNVVLQDGNAERQGKPFGEHCLTICSVNSNGLNAREDAICPEEASHVILCLLA